jgi:hypothetical protein
MFPKVPLPRSKADGGSTFLHNVGTHLQIDTVTTQTRPSPFGVLCIQYIPQKLQQKLIFTIRERMAIIPSHQPWRSNGMGDEGRGNGMTANKPDARF